MHALCRARFLLIVPFCGLLVGCGSDAVAPSLVDVDPATVLFADDFNTENNQVGVYNWTSFANWTVLAGCADLHGNGFHDVEPGTGLYVDLDGSCDAGSTFQTKTAFTLQPGNYVLEFWLAGNQRISSSDTVNVSLGTLHQEQLTLRQRDPFALHTRELSVPSEMTVALRFENLGGDGRGALLDLVRLRRAQ